MAYVKPNKAERAAFVEAQRRWNKSGAVKQSLCGRMTLNDGRVVCSCVGRHPTGCQGGAPEFLVGKIVGVGGLSFFEVKGYGVSWEHAFADADVAEHCCHPQKCDGSALGSRVRPCAEAQRLRARVDSFLSSEAPRPSETGGGR